MAFSITGNARNIASSFANDLWAMEVGASFAWDHMSAIAGHPMEADFDCSGLDFAAKFAVAGDFDGDDRDEIAVAADTPGSAGNDFWVMKWNAAAGAFQHMSPLAGHAMQ